MENIRINRVSPSDSESTKLAMPAVVLAEDIKTPIGYETEISALRKEQNERKRLEAIRRMPLPLIIKRSLRKTAFDDSKNKLGCCSAWRYQQQLKWTKFKASYNEFTSGLKVWRSSFKVIEGNFGTGVVSYFTFLKWLFFLNVYIFILVFGLIVVPQVAFTQTPYDVYVAGASVANGSSAATTLADNCTSRYTVLVDPQNYGQLILDALQGTGWMEKRVLFYGFYEARRLFMFQFLGGALYYNMPLAYLLVTLVVFIVSLVLMVRYTAKGMRENMMSSEEQFFKYSTIIFGGWDFSLETDKAAGLKHKSLFNELASEMREEVEEERRNSRTGCKQCGVYTVRFLVNVLVIIVLGGCGWLIVYATMQSQALTERSDFSSFHLIVQLLIEFLPSLTITILNAVVPEIFNLIVKLEDYRTETEIKFTLIRTVFLKLASVAVLLAAMYVQVTCVAQRDFCSVGVATACAELKCWETYVGQQIYKLVIMDFIVTVFTILLYEFPRRLIVTKCSCKLTKLVGLQEMEIPKNVLELVYGQVLCWLGFFFSPLIPGMCVFKLFITFYLKKISTLFNYVPSSTPYRAARSNTFFMLILIVSFFCCCLPIGFAIWNLEPSRGCGPFRIYFRALDVWNVVVATFPDVYTTVFQIVTSTTVFVLLLLIVIMALYYTYHLARAYKEMISIMKEQIIMEGKDKQFLMRQIKDLNGEKGQSLRQLRAASAKTARHRQTVQVQEQDHESELVHRRPAAEVAENQEHQTENGEKY